MDAETYQTRAVETRRPFDIEDPNEVALALANFGLGVTGEAGEVADIIKKALFHAHSLDTDQLVLELGDILWYIANIAELVQVPLGEVMQRNIKKVRDRYPNGFSPQASINRQE